MKAHLNVTLNNPWYFAPTFDADAEENGFLQICATLSPKDILLNEADGATTTVSYTIVVLTKCK